MDMPSRCKGCDFLLTATNKDFCKIALREIDDCDFYVKRADWCPLREVPQKIGINEAAEMKRFGCIADIINSYNACIDEILRDKEREDE